MSKCAKMCQSDCSRVHACRTGQAAGSWQPEQCQIVNGAELSLGLRRDSATPLVACGARVCDVLCPPTHPPTHPTLLSKFYKILHYIESLNACMKY